MKKITTIAVAFLLFLGTIGPYVNLHYCDGKLFSFSIFNKAKTCCGSHCPSCKDVTAFYKLKDSFENQNTEIKDPIVPDFIVLETPTFSFLHSPGVFCSYTRIHPPPLDRASSQYTEVFRI